jgi:enolase
VELRDGGARYGGRGVTAAVLNVRGELADAVRGLDAVDQGAVDSALRSCDGTTDLSRLGANAVLAVSVAAALATVEAKGVPLYRWLGDSPLLPMPMVNVISGGAHAAGLLDIQDFLVVPVGAQSFRQAIEWSWRVRTATEERLARDHRGARLVADEGGLSAALESNRAALDLLCEGIAASGLSAGEDIVIAIDVAANQLASDGRYALAAEGRVLSARELVAELASWAGAYPLWSIEDPLSDTDWDGWQMAAQQLPPNLQVIGDDLFATNPDLLARGIALGVANAVLIKPNQCGTLSRTHQVVCQATAAGYRTVASARSGDTEDTWLADLAVGWRTGQIKIGSTTRSERTAKWNRLLRIEHELGADAVYAGASGI